MRVSHFDLYAKISDGYEVRDLMDRAIWLYNKDFPKDAIKTEKCFEDIEYAVSLLNELDAAKMAVLVKYCDLVIVKNKEKNYPSGCMGEKRIKDTERFVNILRQFATGELLWISKEQEARAKRNKKKKVKREAKKLQDFVLMVALKGQEQTRK